MQPLLTVEVPCSARKLYPVTKALRLVLQEKAVTTVAEWVADPACAGNAMTLLVAGVIYASEGNYVEALKACHTGLNLEMCGPPHSYTWRERQCLCKGN